MEYQLTFRELNPSDAIAAYVGEKAAKLSTFFDRIIACRVAVEAPHRHHRQGRVYRVRIDIVVPGVELVAGSAPEADVRHQDVYAAIDDAFDDAERVLSDYARRRRGEVKPHENGYRSGEVSKLFPDEGYGFLANEDGGEVYFHQNSVLGHAFTKLRVGSRVRFIEEAGDKGPQASTVAPR
jgi:ribosomal subunit interface protein